MAESPHPSTPPLRVAVREATTEDAPALALVGAATFLDTYSGILPGASILAHCGHHHRPEAYVAFLDRPGTRIWLAEADPGGAPVGYSLLADPDFPPEIPRPGDRELRRIYLLSRFHGTGVGRSLLDHAIAEARASGAGRLLLGVYPHNRRAIAFYRRAGFEQVGNRTFRVGASEFYDPVFALDL